MHSFSHFFLLLVPQISPNFNLVKLLTNCYLCKCMYTNCTNWERLNYLKAASYLKWRFTMHTSKIKWQYLKNIVDPSLQAIQHGNPTNMKCFKQRDHNDKIPVGHFSNQKPWGFQLHYGHSRTPAYMDQYMPTASESSDSKIPRRGIWLPYV